MRKRAKIIATLGPSSASGETVAAMMRAGADAFRVNFSHGSEENWRNYAKAVREAERRLGRWVALIGDLTGPSVRLGDLIKPIYVKRGEVVELRMARQSNGEYVPVPLEEFFDGVEEGDELLVDEGRVRLRVLEVGVDRVKAQAVVDGVIKSRKSLAIFGKELDIPTFTERDARCARFAIEHGFDYVAMSFVRSGADVRLLRDFLSSEGGEGVRVISKIETKAGVERLEEIAAESDAIMVARGDLGNFFPLEEIPRLQREIIDTSLDLGRPVIIATQLLESLMYSPVPTRSEVVDVMVAVREGVDALMLAGETAAGRYPVEAVRWMRRIVERTEYEQRPLQRGYGAAEGLYDRFARGIALLSESLGAKIAVYTRSGRTAARISRYRPSTDIYAGSSGERVARQLSILWGVSPIVLGKLRSREEALEVLISKLREERAVSFGDIVVLAYGIREGATEVVRIVQV